MRYLPWLGWTENYIDEDGYPSEERTSWKGNTLEFQWMNFGVIIFVGKVWEVGCE